MERGESGNPSQGAMGNRVPRNAPLVINEPAWDNANNPNNNNNVNLNNNINNNNDVNPPPYRRDPDHLVPAANINRIMRRILPSHAKVSEDAKELLQDCTSEFISFVTSEANERCHREHRKTVSAEDILYALSRLGFEDYVGPLTAFLNRYRHSEVAQTVAHGDPASVRRTTYFPGAVQPLPPPPQPMNPPPTYHPMLHNFAGFHNVVQGQGLFDQYYYAMLASSSNMNNGGGGGGELDGPSESCSTSSLPPPPPPPLS